MNTQDKKYNYLLYFIGVIPIIWLALLIAPITEGGLVSIFNNFGNVFNNPFNILWSENSIKTILIFLLIYIFVIIFYESSKRNYRRKEEHGSARWGEARTLNKKYKQFPENMNKTLTKNVELGLNGRKHKRNVNVLVVGGSGAGKTFSYCKPNVMQANSSYVILDPKGEILRDTVIYLNLRDMKLRF